MTKAEVMNTIGRPGLVSTFPNLREEVWTYRFIDGTINKLSDAYFDTGSGLFKYATSYPDPAYHESASDR